MLRGVLALFHLAVMAKALFHLAVTANAERVVRSLCELKVV